MTTIRSFTDTSYQEVTALVFDNGKEFLWVGTGQDADGYVHLKKFSATDLSQLYYDIEMFEDTGELAGSLVIPTTTILTQNRIFIPIAKNLEKFFNVVKEKKKFYVKFDVLTSS